MSTAKAKRRKHVASPAATAVGAERRVAPRIPILAQIEAQGARQFVLGRASNISVGSLLVETRETLPEGTTVIVRFFVPPARQPVEAAGRVVREEPGRAMAISFLGLPERHRQKISDYVKASGVPAPVLEFKASERRRTGRIPRRLPVILSWQGEEGYQKQQAGETQDLSQHGARVLLYSPLEPGQLVRVTLPQTGTEAEARVVWARDSEIAERIEAGVEFLGAEDFWGIEFPPPEVAEKPARRRSGRVVQRLGVRLNWVDEWGRVREEAAETVQLSRYGAQVRVPVELAVGQHVRMEVIETGRQAEARVVWARPACPEPAEGSESAGATDIGIAFIGADEFWGIEFPPDPGRSPRR